MKSAAEASAGRLSVFKNHCLRPGAVTFGYRNFYCKSPAEKNEMRRRIQDGSPVYGVFAF